MYTLQGKTRSTRHVRFPRQFTYARRTLPTSSPYTWQPVTSHRQSWAVPLLPRKRAHDTIHSTPTDQSMCSYPVSLLSQPIKQWGQIQASVDDILLDLLDPYQQHVIGTLNTCSRGPTHRSLTDTGGGYNLVGVDLPTPLLDIPNRRFYTFYLMVPLGLRLSIQTLPTGIRREQILNLTSEISSLDFYRSLSSKHSMS
jgi:hypothetical protein